jgi:hypothetical protein
VTFGVDHCHPNDHKKREHTAPRIHSHASLHSLPMSSSSMVMLLSILPLVLLSPWGTDAFTASKLTAAFTRRQRIHLPHPSPSRHSLQQQLQRQHWALHYGAADYYADDEEDEDEDDDDDDDDILLDADSLGDWRAFRRNLASSLNNDSLTTSTTSTTESSTITSSPTAFLPDMNNSKSNNSNNNIKKAVPKTVRSISKENQELVLTQNEKLHKEYMSDVWAHETATVRISPVSFIFPRRVGVPWKGGQRNVGKKTLICISSNNSTL